MIYSKHKRVAQASLVLPKLTILGRYICRTMNKPAFCIFIDTVCEGRIPAWRDEHLMPVVYPTVEAAQREIADDVMEKLQQFLEGERDFDDAMTLKITYCRWMFCRTALFLMKMETALEKKTGDVFTKASLRT
jgi:hypothetical protein